MTTVEPEEHLEMPPLNVVDALIRVVRDLPAIDKGEKMAGESGGYKYRGIEQMTAAAQPLFGKHGVLVCPRVLESKTEPITKGGKPWVHREMRVEYILRGPQGEKDYIAVGPFVAEADDNSDKSANKCMTQAFKQMLLQVLCISDRKDDPDDASQGRDAAPADAALLPVSPAVVNQVVERARRDGYQSTEVLAVIAEVTGRDDQKPLSGEWEAIRDAWIAYKAENPRQTTKTDGASPSEPGEGSSRPEVGSALSAVDAGPAPAAAAEVSTGEDDTPKGQTSSGRAEVGSRAKKS